MTDNAPDLDRIVTKIATKILPPQWKLTSYQPKEGNRMDLVSNVLPRRTHQIDAGRKMFPMPRTGTSVKGMSKEERTKGKTELLHHPNDYHCNNLGDPNSRNERSTTRLL